MRPVTSPFAVPRSSGATNLETPTKMQQWEYRKIELSGAPLRMTDVDLLSDAGRHGWELVAISGNNIAYLKRPVSAPKRSNRA